MIITPCFLFDECIGKPVMEQLSSMVDTEIEFKHVVDCFGQGSKDSHWISTLANSYHCVVITSDGGKNSRRGEKLPEICRLHNITHIVISSTLHVSRSSEKLSAFVLMWSEIMATMNAPPGSRFKLRYTTPKGTGGSRILRLMPA